MVDGNGQLLGLILREDLFRLREVDLLAIHNQLVLTGVSGHFDDTFHGVSPLAKLLD